MKDKLLEIFNHYGANNQRKKLCEEFMELQDELYKWYELEFDAGSILTEIADVLVLVMQFAYEYGYDEEIIKEEMEYKINRQIDRIKKGE